MSSLLQPINQIGTDKFKHVAVMAILGQMLILTWSALSLAPHVGPYLLSFSDAWRVGTMAGLLLLIGLGKEFYDYIDYGRVFGPKVFVRRYATGDMLANAIGIYISLHGAVS